MPMFMFNSPEAETAFKGLGDPETVHDLLRIHPESRVEIGLTREGNLFADSRHRDWQAKTVAEPGKRWLHNERIFAERGVPGTGTKILARQVLAARKLGFDQIHIHHAAGEGPSDYFSGSYVWPRLGFNRDLPHDLWKHFPGHKDFHSIMKDPRLIEKWKNLRRDIFGLVFHTAADSPHSQHLLEYMKSKGIKI